MGQAFLRPDADQSDGSWLNEASSNTNLFASVDETSASDSDYIQSSTTVGDKVRLRLSDPGSTVSQPLIVRYRCKRAIGTASAGVIGRLIQGVTQKATWTQAIDDTLTTYTYTLTSGEFTSISDFNDLYVEFEYAYIWWLSNATIDLDFADALYYDSGAGGTGQAVTSYLSCVRASNGYVTNADGTLTSFGSNTLRIGTGTGLLVEGSRTNTIYASQDISDVNWTVSNCTLSADSTAAPDGTTTADKLTATGSNQNVRTFPTVASLPGATTFTWSTYMKVNSGATWANLLCEYGGENFYCSFNLTGSGTIGTSGTTGTGTFTSSAIEALANGWYRVSIAGQLVDTTHDRTCYIRGNQSGDNTFSAVTGDSHFVWGVQAEVGAFVSSYIPTTTPPATRAADAVSCIGNLDTLLKASARTSVVDLIASATPVTWDIVAGSSAGNELVVSSSDVVITSNTTTKSFSGSGAFTTGVKVGAGTSGSATSVTGEGLTVATGSSGVAMTGTVYLGSDATNYWYGYIRRGTFWNSKLADATLQGLTA